MTAAAAPAVSPPSILPAGPSVVIDYRPPCAVARQELFGDPDDEGGVHGPEADRVAKAICRSLDLVPGALRFEPDPAAKGRAGSGAACYVVDALDRRLAHVRGLSAAWLGVASSRLRRWGWFPGQNREVVLRLAADPAAP